MEEQEKSNDLMNFSERLRNSVNESGKSQIQIAREVGIKAPYLSQIASGKIGCKDIDLKTRLANATGVSPEWLITGNGEKKEEERKKLVEETEQWRATFAAVLPNLETKKLFEFAENITDLNVLKIIMDELRSRNIK